MISPENPAWERLSDRLQALAEALKGRDDALGLLALGSIGSETERVDEWSDLDFFVIVRPEAKARYIAALDWLAAAHPLLWHFQNTADGHKALMADGVYCEFAVFEPRELGQVPYSPGRWVWVREGWQPQLAGLAQSALPMPQARSVDWLAGEALSNLLVGLQRDRRGERLAAMRLIQVHALDRVLELREQLRPDGASQAAQAARDAFSADRRVELRWPGEAAWLADAACGYTNNAKAAKAVLHALQSLVAVSDPMRKAIEALLPHAED